MPEYRSLITVRELRRLELKVPINGKILRARHEPTIYFPFFFFLAISAHHRNNIRKPIETLWETKRRKQRYKIAYDTSSVKFVLGTLCN